MITPVVDSVVRVGFVRKESAPTRADSISAAEFTAKRRFHLAPGNCASPAPDILFSCTFSYAA
jgi:hypothetical protein